MTFTVSGCSALPKLEKESIATFGFDIEIRAFLRGEDGRFRQFFGRRFDRHRRVGAKDDILFEDHHVQAMHLGEAFLFADDFQGRPDGIGIVMIDAGEEGIGVAACTIIEP